MTRPEPAFSASTLSFPVAAGDAGEKIAVRGLNFFYGARRAIADVTMGIGDRSVTALIGPSGCGKSTLLRVLNRIYALYPHQRAEGEVLIDGKNILDPSVDPAVLRTRIGMVAQTPMPFPLSIYDNVAFGLRLNAQLEPRVLDARVEDALRRAGLWDEVKDILYESARALSGGQQQRLCIARTIAVTPEVVLLDEPCSALDWISTARIEQLIGEMAKTCCVVIVTHNIQQAARVSHRTAFMYLGEIVEYDTTEAVFTHPRHPRTEAYVSGRFG